MLNNKTYEFTAVGDSWSTKGLCEYGYPEIYVMKSHAHPGSETIVLDYIAKYMLSKVTVIRPGEKIAFGSWSLRLDAGDDGALFVSEYSVDADDFVDGAESALDLWVNQTTECEIVKADFLPPAAIQMITCSEGVLIGSACQGVRYPAPSHMSGWWITDDSYNGDVKTLKNIHTLEFIAKRFDLARYLGLPAGYCFDLRDNKSVYFDAQVAMEPIS